MNIRKQPEGFCLMQYQDQTTGIIEWIWNSRDEITPFVIPSRDGEHEMQHIRWVEDTYCPNWIPRPGDRVFVDATIEACRESRKQYVERYWNDDMASRWKTKEQAIEDLAQIDVKEYGGHSPRLVIVPESGWITSE